MVSAPSTTPLPAGPPPLPRLSDHESHLLSTFLILRYDMIALAEQEKLQPAQLLAFAQSPAVQAHLAALKTFADQAYALRSLESRIEAINALESITKTTDNPIEKRRAASSILRGLNPVGGPGGTRSIRADRREPSVFSSSPSTPAGGGAALRGGGGSVPTSSTHPPHSRDADSTLNASNHHRPSPPHSSPSSALSTQSSALSPDSGPPSDIPILTPSPNLTPVDIARFAMRSCLRRSRPSYLAAFQGLFAPSATLDNNPITDFNSQAPTFHPNGAYSILPRGPESATSAQVRITAVEPPHHIISLTRQTDSPHPTCWLISDISIDPDPRRDTS